MSWEREYRHVDKAEGVYRYGYIERSVINRMGEPHRAEFIIRLGMGPDGESCAHCKQPIMRDIVLSEEGKLIHATRGEVNPDDLAKEELAKYIAFHARMDAFVARHHAPLYKGPK